MIIISFTLCFGYSLTHGYFQFYSKFWEQSNTWLLSILPLVSGTVLHMIIISFTLSFGYNLTHDYSQFYSLFWVQPYTCLSSILLFVLGKSNTRLLSVLLLVLGTVLHMIKDHNNYVIPIVIKYFILF